jgi:hypothetical protein
MRSAGRALALDPESPEAAEIVTTLMLKPPKLPPPEVQEAMHVVDAEGISKHARTAVFSYVVLAAFLPIANWNGIRDWNIILAIVALCTVLGATALGIVIRRRISMTGLVLYALGNAGLMALLARAMSPWTFVPAITCIIIMSMMAYPQLAARPWILIAIFVTGFSVLIGLEVRGDIAAGWEIRDGAIVISGLALDIARSSTLTLMFAASVATIVVAGIQASATYRNGRQAQQQLAMQAWHLQQLLPPARTSQSQITSRSSQPQITRPSRPDF